MEHVLRAAADLSLHIMATTDWLPQAAPPIGEDVESTILHVEWNAKYSSSPGVTVSLLSFAPEGPRPMTTTTTPPLRTAGLVKWHARIKYLRIKCVRN
jgi:hypothetical protein